MARFGRLDVLVNNAGRAMWARFDQLADVSVIEEIMRVNFLGSVYSTHAALEPLKKTRGLIVAMASVSGLTGVPLLSGYSASKHAIIGFFESLRIELAESGVGVTIVAPDFVQSEILERAAGETGQPLAYSPLDQAKLMTAEACTGGSCGPWRGGGGWCSPRSARPGAAGASCWHPDWSTAFHDGPSAASRLGCPLVESLLGPRAASG